MGFFILWKNGVRRTRTYVRGAGLRSAGAEPYWRKQTRKILKMENRDILLDHEIGHKRKGWGGRDRSHDGSK